MKYIKMQIVNNKQSAIRKNLHRITLTN